MRFKLCEDVITNPRVTKAIWDCLDICDELHLDTDNIEFESCNVASKLAYYEFDKNGGEDGKIYISTHIFNDDMDVLKETILHEIAHYFQIKDEIRDGNLKYINGKWKRLNSKYNPHDSYWRKYTRAFQTLTPYAFNVTGKSTGINTYKQQNAKYVFRCVCCGAEIYMQRASKFTKTYDEKLPNGKYRWTCTRCGDKGHFEMTKGD